MSLIEMMKKKKKEFLKVDHPLHEEERGTRFAYAVGIAMGAIVDGTVHDEEKKAIDKLVFCMDLPEEDGARVIETAQKADESTITSILDSLKDQSQRCLFLIDLWSINSKDGSIGSEEGELWNLFADMMKIDEKARTALKNLAEAALEKDGQKANKAITDLFDENIEISIKDLKYFIPDLDYMEELEGQTISSGQSLTISRPTRLKGPLVVENGGELKIKDTELHLSETAYGPVEGAKFISAVTVIGGFIEIEGALFVHEGDTPPTEGNMSPRMLTVMSTPPVKIKNSTFEGKRKVAGMIFVNSSLSLEGSSLKGCYGAQYGAGVFCLGPVSITEASFEDCHSLEGNGGGLHVDKNGAQIIRTTFKNCCSDNGGAISFSNYFNSTEITMTSIQINNCFAKKSGGGICFIAEEADEKLSLVYSSFTPHINQCVFENCSSKTFGGAVSTIGTTSQIKGGEVSNCIFKKCNSAQSDAGGGFDLSWSIDPSIEGNTFENCTPLDQVIRK